MRLQCLRHAREHFFLPELVAKILKLRDSTKSKVLFPHLKKKKRHWKESPKEQKKHYRAKTKAEKIKYESSKQSN